MVTKLGQFTNLGPFSTFQFFKLSKLCYRFLSSFEIENIFFLICLAIPRPSPSGIHLPINLANKIDVSVNFQKKRKSDRFFRYPSQHFSCAFFFFFWKWTETSIFLVKLIGQWIPNGHGRGIARNIIKKKISFSKLDKK